MQSLELVKRNRNYTVIIPRPELKSGKSIGRFCAFDFNQFFNIPNDAIDLRITLAKREIDESYELKHTRTKHSSSLGGSYYTSDFTLDGFRVPGMYSGGASAFKWALKNGFKYARVDYRVPLA